MVPQKANDDLWMAEVLTYIRNSFGNTAPTITPERSRHNPRRRRRSRRPTRCAELAPFLAIPRDITSQWAFTASDNAKEAERALDGDPKTPMVHEQTAASRAMVPVRHGQAFLLTRMALDATASKDDYPRKYEVRTSDDGEHWSDPVASGTGASDNHHRLPRRQRVTRYVRITQTGSDKGCFWSFNELAVYGGEAKSP